MNTLATDQYTEFSLLHIQTSSGAHLASYPMHTGSMKLKLNTHLPTSAEVKKMWINTSIPPYAFLV
jgi:hypothetical protein